MEMNKSEKVDEIKEAWKKAPDQSVIKAATEDWKEYPSHVQAIIEAEAKSRGWHEKILHLRSKKTNGTIVKEGNIEGYICEGCKGTSLNLDTGRCERCELPSDDIGYCIECDNFWNLVPMSLCPVHNTKLSKGKSVSQLVRLGNRIFDQIILYIIVFVVVVVFVAFGLVSPEFFDEIDSGLDFIFGCLFIFIYYVGFETIWQRTPGKFITGTKVIRSDGSKPSLGIIFGRTLMRFVPFEAFSFLGARVYGWHDRCSGTYLIKAKRFRNKDAEQNQVLECPQSNCMFETPERSVEILPSTHRKVESCQNCERTIGKLEPAYVAHPPNFGPLTMLGFPCK